MNRLPLEKRAQIVYALCEGTSIRACSRMFKVSTNTILDLLERTGQAAAGYQDEHIRDVRADFIQLDEIHSFIGQKGQDIWCWVALESLTKLRVTWHVGDRSSRSALLFCGDLASRLHRRGAGAQITSDGLASYRWAVATNMPDTHFAQLVKRYELDPHGFEVCVGASKMPLQNDPDPDFICTSHVEASNLHMRMQNRRYARRTNAHSKIIANHAHMIALGFWAYNYVRKHTSIKCTPAQAAGLADHPWTMEELIQASDDWHEANLNARFEEAFRQRMTPPRTHPKSYPPTPKDQLPVPWYLDPNGTPPTESPE